MDNQPQPLFPLFRLYPSVEQEIAREPLCRLPTPVGRAEKIERDGGIGPLFIKRDDLSAPEYGGNKPRKLEWLLGDARQRGASRVITFGALGTNLGFATAFYAARLGLACELVLIKQPLSEAVRRHLLLDQAVGARLYYARNVAGAVLIGLGRLARHPRTRLIPAGGSSPRGTIGFVNAGLELAEQIKAGELPEPARIYLALGSGGTAAGLALGLALAGLRTRVVAVLVSHIMPPNRAALLRLAKKTLTLLRRAGAAIDETALDLRIDVEEGFVGGGYGHPTTSGGSALEIARELEGLHLDPTYTGKALGALLDRERGHDEPVLFWNTYAASEPDLALPDPRSLPPSFHRFFRDRG